MNSKDVASRKELIRQLRIWGERMKRRIQFEIEESCRIHGIDALRKSRYSGEIVRFTKAVDAVVLMQLATLQPTPTCIRCEPNALPVTTLQRVSAVAYFSLDQLIRNVPRPEQFLWEEIGEAYPNRMFTIADLEFECWAQAFYLIAKKLFLILEEAKFEIPYVFDIDGPKECLKKGWLISRPRGVSDPTADALGCESGSYGSLEWVYEDDHPWIEFTTPQLIAYLLENCQRIREQMFQITSIPRRGIPRKYVPSSEQLAQARTIFRGNPETKLEALQKSLSVSKQLASEIRKAMWKEGLCTTPPRNRRRLS